MNLANVAILNTVITYCGLTTDGALSEQFRTEIYMHINVALQKLFDMGVGSTAFILTEDETTWGDYFGESPIDYYVVQYISLSVKVNFDPSPNVQVQSMYTSLITELERRLVK